VTRRRKQRAVAVAMLSVLMLPAVMLGATAATVAAQPPPPVLTTPVNDFAGILDAASTRELERRIRALQSATGDTLIVATVKTYKPDYADMREYSVKMFENAGRGVGERGKDNGLLLVVAVEDRQVGIEVGYGLEGIITDGFSGQTIREVIRPAFRNGDYGGGLVAGTTRLINRIADARGVNLNDVPRQPVPRPQVPDGIPWGTIIFFLVIILLMSQIGGGPRRRRRRWGGGTWSNWDSGVGPFGGTRGGFNGGFGGFGGSGGGFGGGGGGFGGFGGGRSGGGGASGGW
jgi:uncharacterized protein